MRSNLQVTERTKDRLGHIVVAAMLIVAVLATSCGDSDVPESRATVGIRDTPTQPTGATTPPRPFGSNVKPTPESTTPDTVEQPEYVSRGPVTFDEAEGVFFEKRYEEATQLFTAYVEQRPDNTWGHYMLGLSAWKNGDYELAERSFDTTLERDPKHLKSLRNLGRVFLETARPEDAVEQLNVALEIDPNSGETHRLLGRAHVQLGNQPEAIESYQRAVVLDEEDAWSMNNLALVLIREERFEEALLPLARAVQLRDDVAVFQNNLGIALERTGHAAKSADAYRIALEVDGGYAKAVVNLERVEGKPDAIDAKPVELTLLADNFVELVRGWRGEVTTDEVVGSDVEEPVDELLEGEAKAEEDEQPVEEGEKADGSGLLDTLKIEQIPVNTKTLTTAHTPR